MKGIKISKVTSIQVDGGPIVNTLEVGEQPVNQALYEQVMNKLNGEEK